MHHYDHHSYERAGWGGPDPRDDSEPNDLATRVCFAAARVIAFSVPVAGLTLWLWLLLGK
jgi:hypothetical protein